MTEKILNQEVCRTCGKCCKQFAVSIMKKEDDPDGFVKRMTLLKNVRGHLVKDIGPAIIEIIEAPCRELIEEHGRYRCAIYGNDARPKLCEEYPLNMLESNIPEIIKYESTFCPLLREILKKGEVK